MREGASGASSYDNRYHIICENNGEAYLGFYVPNNMYAGIRFADTTGLEGYIDYYFSTDEMVYSSTATHKWTTAGSERLRITATGAVLIGTSSYQYAKPLNVQGSSGHIISLYNGDTTTYAANTLSGIELKLRTGNTGNQFGSCEIRAFKDNGTNGDNARSLSFYTGSNGGSPVERLRIQSSGHVVPGANNSYDLGSTSLGWRNVYMNDLNLSNMEGNKNDVDGTQGSWTIQEGKDDLYIINRLNGKKFKIKMEEIS